MWCCWPGGGRGCGHWGRVGEGVGIECRVVRGGGRGFGFLGGGSVVESEGGLANGEEG